MIAGGALLFWLGAGYRALTKSVPDYGGQYTEGVVAQPRYLNPLLSQTSDADADIVELLYAGLFRYESSGKIVPHIAQDFQISDDGRSYIVFLRPGVHFHDGDELTADDVVFTVRTIQDPAFKSPLRGNWLGVEVSASDPYTVHFTLKKPYFGFLANLTVGILPKHVWQNATPETFTLTESNLTEPIGAGPYVFDKIDKDVQGNILAYHFRSFRGYFAGRPYIDRVSFRFFSDEESALTAFNHHEIMGLHAVHNENVSAITSNKDIRLYPFSLPRVFSVFLNTHKSIPLAYDEVRQALALSVDRQMLIDDVLKGYGTPVRSALPPFVFGSISQGEDKPNLEQANSLLEVNGWKLGSDGIREKDGVHLAFTLAVPDWPELARTADLLRDEWRAVGAQVEVKVISQADLQQSTIRSREYEALLFGQGSSLDPDPYSFWHSSQKDDPGLNIAAYENKEVDDLLTKARESNDPTVRQEQYARFQEIIAHDVPAIFLYSPSYLYPVSNRVQGIQARPIDASADRLSDIATWYIETKRVRK